MRLRRVLIAAALLLSGSAPLAAQLAPVRGQCLAVDRNRILVRRGDGILLYGFFDKKLEVRDGIDNVVAVAMSGNGNGANPIMLRGDGTVWQWSWQGTTHYKLVQVKNLENVVHISQGGDGSAATLADGTVREWKQIGGPAMDITGITNVARAEVGEWRTYFLLRAGEPNVTVRGWIRRTVHRESETHGMMATLGTGSMDDGEQRKPIAKLDGRVQRLFVGGEFAAAISEDSRTVWAWGEDQGVKAPRGDYEESSYYPTNHAVRVPQLTSSTRKPVMVLSKLALYDDGTLKRWFSPHYDATDIPEFKDVVAIETNGSDVSTFAMLHSDGRLVLFGYGENNAPRVVAQLGSKTAADCAMTNVSVPANIAAADFTPADPSDRTGIIEPWRGVDARASKAGPRITKADSAAFANELITLRDIVNAAPTLVQRHRFDLRAMADLELSERFPVFGKYWFQTFKLPRYRGDHSYVSGTFGVNPNLRDMIRATHVGSDGGVDYFTEPRQVTDADGFPSYGSGTSRITVITKGDRPWVVPVSQERWLTFHVAQARTTVEATRNAQHPAVEKFRAQLKALEDKLASLSVDERAQQAIYCVTELPLSTTCGPDSERKIVMANPDFYDRSLPKTAIQAIVVHYMFTESSKSLAEAIHNAIDFARVASLLK